MSLFRNNSNNDKYSDYAYTNMRKCKTKTLKRIENSSYDTLYHIELKPVVGDDFPSVLRQMKGNRSEFLVTKDYTGKGATKQEFIDYFKTQGRKVVFERDIENVVLPDYDKVLQIDFDNL